ncbi:peptide-methionine (S)-S-oxide reductase MsrA [Polaribacter litorisediminis]|uniref:peptide-methionine (S)-S-oxide reductase MsrA n=1 Tax=Polaribacter litorisediminis TaxID=1908341 RepID=UPI001CBAC510|nr:peptide-methionine (S)-S-oxide reductase MsrA [Polaribacter litorisediminis]UAM99533.1 peptide-methionine (S)-S-oxide reductase MsrA [Polaribacter litorisediminis]
MKFIKPFFTIAISLLLISCLGFSKKEDSIKEKPLYIPSENTQIAYFASGCFWCVEAIFESVIGVEEAVSGYAGGQTKNPTYQSIGTGRTGHAETVAVYYNPKKVSFETLVTVFFGSHDPTTVNGQHPDYGTQYRSIAFYSNASEKKIIDDAIAKLNVEKYNGKIVTEVTKFTEFYKAEEYHQDFERRNPNQGYVKAVSVPRLNKFKSKFPELLKENKH